MEILLFNVVVIYKAFCLNVAQGHINGAPNETRTHSCWFVRGLFSDFASVYIEVAVLC